MADMMTTYGLDSSEFRRGMDRVLGDSRSLRRQVDATLGGTSAGGLTDSMLGLSRETRQAVTAFTKMIGVPAMIAGVATGAYALGQTIREHWISVFETADEKAAKFFATMDAGTSSQRLEKINAQIADLSGQLGGSEESTLGWVQNYLFGGGSPEKIEEQLKSLGITQSLLQGVAVRDKNTKQEDLGVSLEQESERVRASTFDGSARVQMEADIRLDELRQRLDKAEDERQRNALQRTISFTEQKRDIELAGIEEKRREEERAAQDKAERVIQDRNRALEDLGLDSAETQLKIASIGGDRGAVERARIELDLARDLLRIKRDTRLTEEDKASITQRTIEQARDEAEALGKLTGDKGPGRELAAFSASLGGFGNAAQIAGAGLDPMREQVSETRAIRTLTKEGNEVLKQIKTTLAGLNLGWG